VLLSAALAVILDTAFTVEWSTPLCTRDYQQWSGRIAGAYGFPLPYGRPSIGTSLEQHVMVHVYAFNMAVLSAALFPLARAAAGARPPRVVATIANATVAMAGLVLVGRIYLLWQPVTVLTYAGERYREMRPIGLVALPPIECRPSRFWFGSE
jgi:hypothetical protein